MDFKYFVRFYLFTHLVIENLFLCDYLRYALWTKTNFKNVHREIILHKLCNLEFAFIFI